MNFSNCTQGLLESVHRVYLIRPNEERKRFAFRIGLVGGPIDRYDEELLGKVLDSRNFEAFIGSETSNLRIATENARILLKGRFRMTHAPERNRLVYAGLTGENKVVERGYLLSEAISWLKKRDVDAICLQHAWMRTVEMRSLLLQNFPQLNAAVMDG